MKYFTRCLAICWLVVMSLPVLGADLKKVATVEGITEYRLDNGLRVILFPDPGKPTTTVNITYLVGSRHEAYGETGMAHLLEHLVFKGTPNHPNIPQELTERGASPNGTTSFDRTNYFETFPSSDDNLTWALDLEADRMVNSFIAADDLESEMTVVRNEMESGENNPMGMLYKRTMSMAYLWHNYGNSTIGARADVESVPIERLQAFYRKYYQPDNAVLVVAGKFDVDVAKKLVIDKFGAIPKPDRSGANRIYPTYTRDPVQDGERSITLRRAGDVQIAMVVHHIPPGSHVDLAALDILSHALTSAPSGRLHEALIETGKAASVSSAAYQYREAGPMLVYAQVREKASLDDAWDAVKSTIYDGLREKPITSEEVERARTFYLNGIDLLFNSSQSVALSLSNWAAMGDWRLFFLHRDRLAQATVDDVNRVAAAYLKPQNSTVGFFIPTESPDRAEIPPLPDIEAMVADYKGRAEVKTGEAFDSSPENIDERTLTVTLANGFELAMLPKSTRGENVVVSLTLLHGSETSLQGRYASGSLAGGMLMRGTERLSRQELIDEFNRLKAQGGVSGGVSSASGSVQTTRDNLAAVLRLAGEVMKSPAFDAAQFEELKQERLAGYELNRSEPNALGSVAINRLLNPLPEGHPNYVRTFDEAIRDTEAVDLDQISSFYQMFYGASNGRMAIVGDFDPLEIQSVVEDVFGNWSSEAAFQRIPNPHHEVPAEKLVIQTPDKANAYFAAGINIPVRDDHEDYPALVLANFMMGGGFLNSRLATRIRQQEGLSYGISSQFFADSLDEAAMFSARAIYAPENAAKLEAAFRDEIDKALKHGFTSDEVSEAKSGYIQRGKNFRSNDRSLAGILSRNLYLDRSMAWTADLEDKIARLKPRQIRAAMRRHIDPEKISIVMAGDFEKGSP
jgi:zinc protease